MPKICYQPKSFNTSTRAVIDQANTIIAEYQAQGFALTLRQLYYQFVARGFLPNKQTEYDRLGATVNNARLAGLIDWNAIEDRTRRVRSLPHFDSPQDLIEAALQSFRHDKWREQNHRVEVWIEKDALVGVIEGICNELDVPYYACRGYNSQSMQWEAGQRFARYARRGITPVVLHLGDHDPSGMDMTRDNEDRLNMFVHHHTGANIIVKRLALNMDQVEQYNPPPNPAKLTDSRSNGYIEKFGDESWELDALNPPVIAQLIRDGVMEFRDEELWTDAESKEEDERDLITQLKDRWGDVAEFLSEEGP